MNNQGSNQQSNNFQKSGFKINKPKLPKWALVLIIILSLAILGLIAYGAYQYFNEESILCAQDVKTCPDGSTVSRVPPFCNFAECPKNSTADSSTDEADWQTYTNEEYGFEFKYPENWDLNHKITLTNPDSSPLFVIKKGIEFYEKQSQFPGISISIWDNPQKLNIINWIDSFENMNFLPGDMPKTINSKVGKDNLDAFKYWEGGTSKWNQQGECYQACPMLIYFFSYNDKTYRVVLNNRPPMVQKITNEQIEKFDQILSTFKFIESDQTQDWKTYKNEEYGFEFKYPEEYTLSEPYHGTIRIGSAVKLSLEIVISEISGSALKNDKITPLEQFSLRELLTHYLSQRCKNSNFNDVKWNTLTIDGVKGLEAVSSNDVCLQVYLPWVILKYDNKTYTIKFNEAPSSNFEDKILSTFKFIE